MTGQKRSFETSFYFLVVLSFFVNWHLTDAIYITGPDSSSSFSGLRGREAGDHFNTHSDFFDPIASSILTRRSQGQVTADPKGPQVNHADGKTSDELAASSATSNGGTSDAIPNDVKELPHKASTSDIGKTSEDTVKSKGSEVSMSMGVTSSGQRPVNFRGGGDQVGQVDTQNPKQNLAAVERLRDEDVTDDIPSHKTLSLHKSGTYDNSGANYQHRIKFNDSFRPTVPEDQSVLNPDDPVRDLETISNDGVYSHSANSLDLGKLPSSKRYMDGLADSLIKRTPSNLFENKRYIDSLGDSLIKRDGHNKRYMDNLADSLIKRNDNPNKRYMDNLADSLIKKSDGTNKRYMDNLADSLIKRNPNADKRYMDNLADSLIKRDNTDKRYMDNLADSLIKRNPNADKRYMDNLADSLIKRDNTDKRYMDNLADSLIKRNPNADKRYMDNLADSLIKRDNTDKRYIDNLADSLIKKSDNTDKRYMDNLADSLIKRDNTDKRYMDTLADSLIKRNPNADKRYMDNLADSLIKRNPNANKRYMDNLADSLIKRNPNADKRYMDNLADSLIKRDNTDKRYMDNLADSLIKRNPNANKRYMDNLADSLIKRNPNANKRYMDNLADSLIKKSDNTDKRYMDNLADSLIKKSDNTDKRYMDNLADSLIKKSDNKDKRYMDNLADSLIKRTPNADKRYMDNLADSLIKRNSDPYAKAVPQPFTPSHSGRSKRYIDSLADSLIKRSDLEVIDDLGGDLGDGGYIVRFGRLQLLCRKRFLPPGMTLSGLRRQALNYCSIYTPSQYQVSGQRTEGSEGNLEPTTIRKRAMEVTDDVMDGSRSFASSLDSDASSIRKKRSANDNQFILPTVASMVGELPTPNSMKRSSYFHTAFLRNPSQIDRQLQRLSPQEETRYLDPIASDVISKRSDENDIDWADATQGNDVSRTYFLPKRYLDALATSILRKRDWFEDGPIGTSKRYIDDIGSSLFKRSNQNLVARRRRYLDPLAASLFKRSGEFPSSSSMNSQSLPLSSDKGGQLELQVNALGRYTPFLKRSPSMFRKLKGRQSNRWSRHSWANRPPTVPVKKMPRASTWEVRPTLMSVMMSPDRRPPVYGDTRSYLRLAMHKYFNDVGTRFLGGGASGGSNKIPSSSRYAIGGDRSRGISRFNSPSFSSGSSHDYFDSLAGNILQT